MMMKRRISRSFMWIWVVTAGIATILGVQACVPVEAPSAPSALVAAADSQSQITLTWTDNSSNESGFRIERSATGTDNWSQVGSVGKNVTTYMNTGLGINTLWYYRVYAWNNGGSSDYSNTANEHTDYYRDSQNGTPVWKALLLVYHQTDTDYVVGGVTQHYTGALLGTEASDAISCFRDNVARVHEFSNREAIMQYKIVHITDHAVTSVTDMGGENYWASPTVTAADLDLYAPNGTYDSIFVFWKKGPIPSTGWGWSLGHTTWANGSTYLTVTEAPASFWAGNDVWLHEWLHGACYFYGDDLGYPMPANNADGGGSHGYSSDPVDGWAAYYRDLMTGQVWEPALQAYAGITTAAWRDGTIIGDSYPLQSEYFWTDTTSRFKIDGTVAWDGRYSGVAIGTSTAGNNSMYTTLRPAGNFSVTGRVYVPSTGYGTWDSVAVALRGGGVQWWANIEYGSSLTHQLSLMKGEQRMAVLPMAIASGWYTIEAYVNLGARTISMRAWPDGANKPDAYQVSAQLDAGWAPEEVGFRHYGQGTKVDDLFLLAQ